LAGESSHNLQCSLESGSWPLPWRLHIISSGNIYIASALAILKARHGSSQRNDDGSALGGWIEHGGPHKGIKLAPLPTKQFALAIMQWCFHRLQTERN
jgi:hypothetical protein